jgi:hypothetical protein
VMPALSWTSLSGLTERREAGGCQEPARTSSGALASVAVPLYISTHVTKFEARALASPSATVVLGGLLQNLNWVRPQRKQPFC